jgi:cytoskeletal protein CcmA (bactofilin family)
VNHCPRGYWTVFAVFLLAGCLFSGGEDGKKPNKTQPIVTNPKDTAKPVDTSHIPPVDTTHSQPPTDTLANKPQPIPDTAKPADTASWRLWLSEAEAKGWSTAEEWNKTLKPGQSWFGLVWTRGDSVGVKVYVHPFGLYRRAVVRAFTSSRLGGLANSASGLLGRRVPLDDFPAFGMTNESGNFVAGGNTVIDGKVLLTRGWIRPATDYNIRFVGDIKKAVVVTDSSPLWRTLPLTFEDATEWILLRETDFTAMTEGKTSARDSLREPMHVLSGDTMITNAFSGRLFSKGRVSISGNARLENAEIWAEVISIQGTVTTRNVLLYGRSEVSISGEPDLDGQFLSRDSMRVNMQSRHSGNPIFYVNGWYSNKGYTSTLDIQDKTRARGLFLVGAYDLPLNYYQPTLILGDSSQVDGMLYTNAGATLMGEVHGSAICEINRFEYHGTLWLGHTFDATFIGFPPGSEWLMPPIFNLGTPAWSAKGEAAY